MWILKRCAVPVLACAALIAGYGIGMLGGRQSLPRLARALLPAQAVAISTQSSLASLPAMLQSCRALGVRETTADFVLPLAVALFRATGPVMNLAVAIYLARLAGVELTPTALSAGVAVALVTTIGSVSLPSAVSFVASIGPVAIVMGVPVEAGPADRGRMVPDIMRTSATSRWTLRLPRRSTGRRRTLAHLPIEREFLGQQRRVRALGGEIPTHSQGRADGFRTDPAAVRREALARPSRRRR